MNLETLKRELMLKEKEIADLHVLIDTLQTNLRSAVSYLTEQQKKEVSTPSYRWSSTWKPKKATE